MHVKEMFDLIIVSIFLIIISRLIENFEAACIKLSIYYIIIYLVLLQQAGLSRARSVRHSG